MTIRPGRIREFAVPSPPGIGFPAHKALRGGKLRPFTRVFPGTDFAKRSRREEGPRSRSDTENTPATNTMKHNMFTLLAPLLAVLLWNAPCSSDASSGDTPDNPPAPQPVSYDIYVAGYKTVNSKAVATVWKNGSELYALTAGTSDALA